MPQRMASLVSKFLQPKLPDSEEMEVWCVKECKWTLAPTFFMCNDACGSCTVKDGKCMRKNDVRRFEASVWGGDKQCVLKSYAIGRSDVVATHIAYHQAVCGLNFPIGTKQPELVCLAFHRMVGHQKQHGQGQQNGPMPKAGESHHHRNK